MSKKQKGSKGVGYIVFIVLILVAGSLLYKQHKIMSKKAVATKTAKHTIIKKIEDKKIQAS